MIATLDSWGTFWGNWGWIPVVGLALVVIIVRVAVFVWQANNHYKSHNTVEEALRDDSLENDSELEKSEPSKN